MKCSNDKLTYIHCYEENNKNEDFCLGIKLNKQNVFCGPIMMSMHKKDEVFSKEKVPTLVWKEKALLVRVREIGYVDVDNLQTLLKRFRVRKDLCGNGFFLNGSIITTFPNKPEDMYVNVDELTNIEDIPDKISIKQLVKMNYNK